MQTQKMNPRKNVTKVCLLVVTDYKKVMIQCKKSDTFGQVITFLSAKSKDPSITKAALLKSTLKSYFGRVIPNNTQKATEFTIGDKEFVVYHIVVNKFPTVNGNVSLIKTDDLMVNRIEMQFKGERYSITYAIRKATIGILNHVVGIS